jgi:hypothetical protein
VIIGFSQAVAVVVMQDQNFRNSVITLPPQAAAAVAARLN